MSSKGEYYGVEKFGTEYVAMYDHEQHLMGERFATEKEAWEFVYKDQALRPIPMINGLDCPACGHPCLILGDGGFVICAYIECPNPDYAESLAQHIAEAETRARIETLDLIAKGEGWEDSRDLYAAKLGIPHKFTKRFHKAVLKGETTNETA